MIRRIARRLAGPNGPARLRRLSTAAAAVPTSLTVSVGSGASKQDVVEAVRKHMAACLTATRSVTGMDDGDNGNDNDALVLLASRDFAAWLDDRNLLAGLVAATETRRGDYTSVLGAAVDAIPWPDRRGQLAVARSGLALLRGRADDMLPRLWEEGAGDSDMASQRAQQQQQQQQQQPSLAIRFPRLRGSRASAMHLEVTVPLANTVFHNGRPFALSAGRWTSEGGPEPTRWLEKQGPQRLVIPPPLGRKTTAQLSAPLVAITRPRRIVAGLGNIVRLVDDGNDGADGVPASRELEVAIPRLLEARSWGLARGPIGVWALVAPERIAGSVGVEWPQPYEPSSGRPPVDEGELGAETSGLVGALLASGARLQRILSGGGGWGLKQGLLSLDPQTRYALPGDDDVDSFIRSFTGDYTSSADDLVRPGSYIQFFVAPEQPPPLDAVTGAEDAPRIVVGTSAADDDPTTTTEDGIQVVDGHFGALSSQGVYLAGEPGESLERDALVSSKIDVPHFRITVS